MSASWQPQVRFSRMNQNFDVAFEVSFRETAYVAPSESNIAMIYHFRSRRTFH